MKTALITGANRGLGLEFVNQLKERGYYVIGCCRQPDKAKELKLVADEIFQLDVTNDTDIRALQLKLKDRPIDLLVNNAGITGEQGVTVGNIERKNFSHVLDVNCVSAIIISDALLNNIKASEDKQMLVISSTMGSIADNDRGRSYAYRTSKAALNCVMRSFAIDVKPFGVNIMLVHPGWVRTNIGGPNAIIQVEQSVEGMLAQMDAHMKTSHAETIRRFDGGTVPW